MNACPDSDALLTIGDALRWDVSDGLRHLQTCEECHAQLEELRLVRASFLEAERVDDAALSAISASVRELALNERLGQSPRVWMTALEPMLAGVAALIVIVSSGIRIASVPAALAGFALGAALMIGGRMLARSVPALRYVFTGL